MGKPTITTDRGNRDRLIEVRRLGRWGQPFWSFATKNHRPNSKPPHGEQKPRKRIRRK